MHSFTQFNQKKTVYNFVLVLMKKVHFLTIFFFIKNYFSFLLIASFQTSNYFIKLNFNYKVTSLTPLNSGDKLLKDVF